MAPALRKANGESRERKVSPSVEGHVAPQDPPPAAALVKRYWHRGPRCPRLTAPPMTPPEPLTLAHTTQCKCHGLGWEPKGGEQQQQPLPGSPLPSLVACCLRAARAGVWNRGSQLRWLWLLQAARPAALS